MSNIVKEFESRIMLTENEYFVIVSHYLRQYPNKKFLQNVNVYLDTEDLFLRKRHTPLRLRIINDAKYELTLKIKGQNGDDEINDDLTKSGYDLLINHDVFPDGMVRNYLLMLPYPLDNYKQITTLYNRRLEIEIDDCLIVIDKNVYSDITDYNLEIESKNSLAEAKQMMKQLIKQFNLSQAGQIYLGKAHRAIDAARKKN